MMCICNNYHNNPTAQAALLITLFIYKTPSSSDNISPKVPTFHRSSSQRMTPAVVYLNIKFTQVFKLDIWRKVMFIEHFR